MEEIKKEETQSLVGAGEVSKVHAVKNKIVKCVCGNKMHFIAGVVLILILASVAGYYYKTKPTDIGLEGAKNKVLEFVNGNLLQPGTEAELVSVAKENDLYVVTIKVGEQEIPTYLTRDGKKFFPQAMETEITDADAEKKTTQAMEIPKTDKPTVELFVMSYCPYGTQMEKGILPVISTLGDKMDYSLKFVDYAMHGNKEIDENLRQYCIQKNQPTKLSTYLACFLKKGEGTSDACLTASGISATSIKSCVAQTDAKFSIKKDATDKAKWSNAQYPPFNIDKDDNLKYTVQGSPTLVVNGVIAESGRDSASILKVICEAFNNAPEECLAQLSATAPAPGFGEGKAATDDAASCAN
jgi:hypothetical protein